MAEAPFITDTLAEIEEYLNDDDLVCEIDSGLHPKFKCECSHECAYRVIMKCTGWKFACDSYGKAAIKMIAEKGNGNCKCGNSRKDCWLVLPV